MSEQVVIQVLPGEPKDGTGRVRIHWFVRSQDGPAQTPTTAHAAFGPLADGHPMRPGVRGYIACQRNRKDVTPQQGADGAWRPCVHTAEVRAATCPECLATPEAKNALAQEERMMAP